MAYRSITVYTCQPTIYKLSERKESLQIYSFLILKVVDLQWKIPKIYGLQSMSPPFIK